MKKLFLLALAATTLVSCYTQSELDEHKETYEALAVELNAANEAQLNQIGLLQDEINTLEDALADASATIVDNEAQIALLVENVDVLSTEVEALTVSNTLLITAVTELNAEIESLELLVAEYDVKITDLNALLAAEIAKVETNVDVIAQLNQDLTEATTKYDSLIANPVVITQVRTQILEVIVETQQEFTNEEYNAMYLGVSELRGLINGVIANLQGDLEGIQADVANETANFDILKGRENELFAAIATASEAARPATVAAWREAQDISDDAEAVLDAYKASEAAIVRALNRLNELNVRVNSLLTN